MNHLQFAHRLWTAHLRPDDVAIDATCGNGHDTLVLSQLLPSGQVFAFDIQAEALRNTEALLRHHQATSQVTLHHRSHLELRVVPCAPRLIVYNLGYLPGGDKAITTQTPTTVESVKLSLEMVARDGALSITCYPGHAEGAREKEALLALVAALPSHMWTVCHHQWVNRPKAPSVLWMTRS